MKICIKCKLKKQIDLFIKAKYKKDGYTNSCKTCIKIYRDIYKDKTKIYNHKYSKEYYQKNKENIKKAVNFRVKNNPDKIKAENKNYYIKNKEKINKKHKVYRLKYYEKNKSSENLRTRLWKQKNKGKVAAWDANRRSRELNATPKWLNLKHLNEIANFYILAKELEWLNNGEKLHVDHIIPLQGKNVSGLHVPWNLQILPKSLNLKKSNSIEGI